MNQGLRWIRRVAALLLAVTLGTAVGPAQAQNTGSIVGTVVDAQDGSALIGANVALRVAGQPDIVNGTATDPDGAFRLTGLQPNTYAVEVRFVGYQSNQRTVTVEAGETAEVTIELQLETSSLETVVISASRRQEKVLDAPASISVLEPEELESSVKTSSVEAIRSAPGVDMAQTGIDRREVVLRGFNDAFNGSTYVLTDYREAAVPSLAVNIYSIMPNMTLDLERVEVVRGPGSALYGPGVDSGVVHFFTKDPFQYPGTSISVSGGSREYFAGQFRQAGTFNDRFGYKVTGQYARADEWELDLSTDEAQREVSRYFTYETREDVPSGRTVAPVPDPDGAGADMSDSDPENDYQLRREDIYNKVNVNGLLQYQGGATTVSLNGGYSALKSPVQSGIGTLQSDGFGYTYGQIRVRSGGLFSQLYVNLNDGGEDTYVYGTGQVVNDQGIQWNFQSQYDFGLEQIGTQVIAGIDADLVIPRTGGAIVGRNEDDDRIEAYGAYTQTSTDLTEKLAMTLALRADYNNVVEELQLSPRAALVFKANPQNTFRGSYNRSFSTPSTNSLFLDIQAQRNRLPGGNALVFQGLGAADGYTFDDFRSGNERVTFALPTSVIPGFPAELFGNKVSLPQLSIFPVYALTAGQLQQNLASNDIPDAFSDFNEQEFASLVQLFGAIANVQGQTNPLESAGDDGTVLGIPDDSEIGYRQVDGPVDIPPLQQTTTQTFEVGYKGFFGSKVLFTLDAYYEQKQDFIGALRIESPLVYLNPAAIAANVQELAGQSPDVSNALQQASAATGLSPEQILELVAGTIGSTPTGVVQPDQTLLTEQDLQELRNLEDPINQAVGGFLSYRNFGQVQYYGVDVSVQVQATDELSLYGNASWISDDFFDNEELDESDTELSLALNAPAFKAKGGFNYRLENGISFGTATNYVEGFPVQSGPYVGDVDSYFLVDANIGYDFTTIPGLKARLTINNVLDNEHRQFVGAPQLGRLFIGRLQYTLP